MSLRRCTLAQRADGRTEGAQGVLLGHEHTRPRRAPACVPPAVPPKVRLAPRIIDVRPPEGGSHGQGLRPCTRLERLMQPAAQHDATPTAGGRRRRMIAGTTWSTRGLPMRQEGDFPTRAIARLRSLPTKHRHAALAVSRLIRAYKSDSSSKSPASSVVSGPRPRERPTTGTHRKRLREA